MKVATTPELKSLIDPDTFELNFGEEIDKNIKIISQGGKPSCEKEQIENESPSVCLIQ